MEKWCDVNDMIERAYWDCVPWEQIKTQIAKIPKNERCNAIMAIGAIAPAISYQLMCDELRQTAIDTGNIK